MTRKRPHSLVKAAARSILKRHPLAAEGRLELCRRLLANDQDTLEQTLWGPEFAELPVSERHYRISALYMLLMPQGRRQRLAAYFTPPHLCQHILDRLGEHGLD